MDHDQDDGQGERHEGEQPARPGRVHFRRSARNPNGSTAPLRADVLAALGVLKVATYKQLHALIAADEYRAHHRVEHVAEAVRDLEKHKLVDVRGTTSPPGRRPAPKTAPTAAPAAGGAGGTRGGEGAAKPKPGGPGAEKIVGLTPLGLAAAEALGDDRDMGGHARGAGLTGAPHAMLVNELIITAVTGTTTHGAPPRTDKRQAPPRRALPSGPLPGGIEAWATETPHTITGKFNVIPDAVVRLPELGIPVAFLELDRGTMTDIRKVAGKLDNYKRYFDRTVHDGGQERLEVEVRYNVPEPAYGYRHRRAVRPPVLFVLDQGTRCEGGLICRQMWWSSVAGCGGVSTAQWRWRLVVRQFCAAFGVIGMTFFLVRLVRLPLRRWHVRLVPDSPAGCHRYAVSGVIAVRSLSSWTDEARVRWLPGLPDGREGMDGGRRWREQRGTVRRSGAGGA
ncbi:hypothetical protein GCM10009639_61950 [Kitasatospora putterlickiae]|uniref:Uncharacterized protein n=1 Tax=Kitasatospora putterlickiae TaxID=221725 RepID=A0ABN1YFV8_9ACTN